jgi:hypothetical protein
MEARLNRNLSVGKFLRSKECLNVDHAFGCLHRVEVICLTDVSDGRTAYIIRVEVRSCVSRWLIK